MPDLNTRTELRAAFRAELRRVLDGQRTDLLNLAARLAAVDAPAAAVMATAARCLSTAKAQLR